MDKTAIYPGSFDPVTFGHIDLIQRAAKIFSNVIVAVVKKPSKNAYFSAQERLEMLLKATRNLKNVKVEIFEGLIVDFAVKKKSNVLIRGLRMISDFEYELQMALTNRRLNDKIETVFLMPSEGFSFLSSTLIKEAAALGADVTSFVPDFVVKKIKNIKK